MKNLYLDTQITGLRKNTDLITMTIGTDTKDCFYAEFTDYDKSRLTKSDEKIMSRLRLNGTSSVSISEDNESICYELKGTKDEIRPELINFLLAIQNRYGEDIHIVKDVYHYDFVLFIDLLTNGGTPYDVPNELNISASNNVKWGH